MSVEVHVDGRVALGRLSAFALGVEEYKKYAASHGYSQPRVLQGISGPMNSIRLVYTFADLSQFEEHEARTLRDTGYAQVAGAMEFVEGTITYSIFHVVE